MARQDVGKTVGSLAPGFVQWVVAGGIVAGLAAAAVLIAARLAIALEVYFLLLYLTGSRHTFASEIAFREVWVTLKIAAYPLVGNRAFRAGFDPQIVWLGFLVVVGFSIVWGVVFAVVAHGRSQRLTIAIGLLFGVGMALFDLAIVNPSPGTLIEAIPSGLALAFALVWYERRFPPPSRG